MLISLITRPIALVSILMLPFGTALSSNHYTEKQMEALASRVGKTFWLRPQNEKAPTFLTQPRTGAAPLNLQGKNSFEILELTGQASKDPYYKVMFDSGQVGYIDPRLFHEEFNATILSFDPLAEEKKKAEQQAEEEKKRAAWIQSQPWSQAVKDAALKKQPTPGLNGPEVRRVLGPPTRVSKTHGPSKVPEERWFYPDGSVLTFHNGLLSKIEKRQTQPR